MYIAADPEVLQLNTNGTFTRILGTASNHQGVYGIGGRAIDGSADGPNGLAFDAAGDLYVFGSNTKDTLMVDPHGTLRLANAEIYPRGPGGFVTAPDGTAIAMDELSIVRLTPHGAQTLVSLPTTYKATFNGIHGFSPNGIAVGADGTIYIDTFYGNGYTDRSAIAKISPKRHSSLLWEQNSPPRS